MGAAGPSKQFTKYSDAISQNVSVSASGNNTLIAGVAGQTIRVLKLVLIAASAVTVQVLDGATVKGTYPLGTMVLDREENPLILTAGNSFVLNLSSAITVSGSVDYAQS